MNLREGTRRLALLLGAGGFLFGGFVSYFEMQSLHEQSERHNKFEKLAASDIVKLARKNQSDLEYDAQGNPLVEVNSGGLKIIHWSESFEVQSLETTSGDTLYPTPAPSSWSYILVALLPLLGFIIPWGIIRSLGWVCAGFFQPAK